MKKVFLVILMVLSLSMFGCSDADKSKITGYGSEYRVTMYSGGIPVKTWVSTGKVYSEGSSDGYYFKDKATGKLVEVSGDVVIEEI